MAENLLGREGSPYLLQHKDNPVHWYPWGGEALGRAKAENRPVFLSVGYSACHWCHVMAHESFENESTADAMNEHFVNIKVDREERPDIDAIYQAACQRATGQGGWPLSAFLTPDLKPFYIGTYFPVMDSHGRPGFGSLLRQLAQAWNERPSDVKKAAENFAANLDAVRPARPGAVDRRSLDEAAVGLLQMGDPAYGGFGPAPKFPNAACISFMLRYARLSGISRFSEFALRSLRKMAGGGIFDQIGGGFHRYSTDSRWLVPHFEKMLYDNALIPLNYAEAYQITRDGFYLDTMAKTLDFVLRDMASPEGAFYSALDADSEGEEGRYYVWSKSEIRDALGDGAELFCLYYDVTDGGNWEGRNILCNNTSLSAAAAACSVSEDDARRTLAECGRRLLAVREGRPKPGLDDKILASWNGMMATALARGHRVSGEARYLEAARGAVRFILDNMDDGDGGLFRVYKGGASVRGFLDDHAHVCGALLDVFGESPDREYLEAAIRLGDRILERFWDAGGGRFYMTPPDSGDLILRPADEYDLATPSGSSVAVSALTRLHTLTGEGRFADAAAAALESKIGRAAENPFAFGHLLGTAYTRVKGAAEVTLMNTESGAMRRLLSGAFLPEGTVVNVGSAEQARDLAGYPFFAGKEFGERSAVYVCRDGACSPPLRDESEVAARL